MKYISVPYKDKSFVLGEGQFEEQQYTLKPNFISGTDLHQILN